MVNWIKKKTEEEFTRDLWGWDVRSKRATDYLNTQKAKPVEQKKFVTTKLGQKDSAVLPDKETTPKLGSTSWVSSVSPVWGLKKANRLKGDTVIDPATGQPEKRRVLPTDKKIVTDTWKWDITDTWDFTGKQDVPDDYDTKIKDLTNKLNEEEMTNDEIQETERQIKYYEDLKKDQDYLEKQRDTQKEYDAITWEIQDIQSSARLRRGQKSLKDMKTNIAYLGNMGQPAQSAGKLDAIDAQIEEGQKTYNDLRKTEGLMKKARALGQESKADAFEKQMDDLQEQLDDNVSSTLQDALDKIDSAEINGLLYDEDAMESFRIKLLEDTDNTIAELSDRNFKRRAFLLDQYKTIAEESKIRETNKNTVNMDMSEAQGYYVDGNWDPIISADTGTRIDIPEESPMKPVFDKETWMLTTFSLDENGKIVADVQQTYPDATFTEQTIANYASLVAQGKMDIDDVPKSVSQSDAFLSALEKAPWEVGKTTQDYEIKEIDGIGYRHNKKTGKLERVSDIVEWEDDVSKEDAMLWEYTLADWTTITATKWTVDGLNKVMALNPNIQFDVSNLYRTQQDQYRLYGQGRTAEELAADWVPEEYANPEANVVTWTTQSSHMTGNAVDVVLPEGQDKVKYYEGIDAEMEKQGFFRSDETIAKWDYWHYEFKGVDKGIMGALWVPIAYERQIKQMVPTQLMNSEIELEALNDTIQRMWKAGMAVEDAVLTYLWFDITVGNKETAKEYVNVGRNLWENLPTNYFATLSNHLAKWDVKAADKYVSNIVEDKVKTRYWEDAIMTASINQTMKDTRNLGRLIERNPDKIGQFDWRVNDLMRKFKDYPEMTELNTLLTMTQAQTRKHFAWSAVTPSEMEALQDFIWGNTRMTPNNLLTMLNTIKDRTESQFLLQRKQFWYTPLLKDKAGDFIKDKKQNIESDPLGLWLESNEADPLGILN